LRESPGRLIFFGVGFGGGGGGCLGLWWVGGGVGWVGWVCGCGWLFGLVFWFWVFCWCWFWLVFLGGGCLLVLVFVGFFVVWFVFGFVFSFFFFFVVCVFFFFFFVASSSNMPPAQGYDTLPNFCSFSVNTGQRNYGLQAASW